MLLSSPPRAHVSGQQGFSLLEILVAFSILALVIGVVTRVFSGGLANIDVSAHYQRATQHAQNRLDTLGVDSPLRPGEFSGEIDSTYRWQATVKPFSEFQGQVDLQTMPMALYDIELRVQWGDRSNPRTVALRTLRLAQKPGPAS